MQERCVCVKCSGSTIMFDSHPCQPSNMSTMSLHNFLVEWKCVLVQHISSSETKEKPVRNIYSILLQYILNFLQFEESTSFDPVVGLHQDYIM